MQVNYESNYKVLTYQDPTGEYPSHTAVLVQCGTPAPELTGDLAGASVVEVPAQRSAIFRSTPLLPFFDTFGVVGNIAAVTSADQNGHGQHPCPDC